MAARDATGSGDFERLSGCAGGRVYDAPHLAAARKANCEQIYTFNLRQFCELAPELADRIRTP